MRIDRPLSGDEAIEYCRKYGIRFSVHLAGRQNPVDRRRRNHDFAKLLAYLHISYGDDWPKQLYFPGTKRPRAYSLRDWIKVGPITPQPEQAPLL